MAYAGASLRTTSFAASAALLGLAVVAALTMTFNTIAETPYFDTPDAVTVIRPEPSEPEPVRQAEAAVQQEQAIVFVGPAVVLPNLPIAPSHQPNYYGPPEPVVVSDPRWMRRPDGLQRYYPRRALQAGIEGEVVLDCRVSVLGMLSCSVASETPPNWGFADAAQRIAREHQMVPARRDGTAVEGRYRMRVPFRLD